MRNKSDINLEILDILAPDLTNEEKAVFEHYSPEGKAAREKNLVRWGLRDIDFTAEGNSWRFEALLTTGRQRADYTIEVMVRVPKPSDGWYMLTAPAAVRAEAFLKVWKGGENECRG